MTTLKTPAPSKGLFDLLYQSHVPKVINAAIDIGLFDTLSNETMSLSRLSQILKTSPAITGALLNVLVAAGLADQKDDAFALTPPALDFLVRKSETNQINAVKEYSGSSGPFDTLVDALHGKAPAFDGKMWGAKKAALNMEQQQKGGAIQSVVSFATGLPQFKSCTKLCDFAGNIGYLSFALMAENRNLTAHIYDLPEVCALARDLKKDQEGFERAVFHDFDMEKDTAFGSGYDLFLSSHFLYELNANGGLPEFFKRVNRSMVPGGLFISNHVVPPKDPSPHLTASLLELMTKCMGYPTHHLPEQDLVSALKSEGFCELTTRRLETRFAYPMLLLSAVKIK